MWNKESNAMLVFNFWTLFEKSGKSHEDHHDLHLQPMKIFKFPGLATKPSCPATVLLRNVCLATEILAILETRLCLGF